LEETRPNLNGGDVIELIAIARALDAEPLKLFRDYFPESR